MPSSRLARVFSVACGALALSVRQAAACAGSSQAKPVYRAFQASGFNDHLYTADWNEYNAVVNENRTYAAEGIKFLAFTEQVEGSVRLHRLWSGDASDHFYTTDSAEAEAALKHGFVLEDDAAHTPLYIYPSAQCGSVPLYRSFVPEPADHLYTISAAERDGAASMGWKYEFVAGYVFAPDAKSTPESTTRTDATTITKTQLQSSVVNSVSASSQSQSASGSTSSSEASGTSVSPLSDVTWSVLPAPTSMLPDGSSSGTTISQLSARTELFMTSVLLIAGFLV
ncbi:hypothetical protein MKEN_00996100 [Mycena kentingensis (nom. inval.)]|nr:hypothetical protein MKEN_00996100 [Mycena kentingensis (nom. inval.)]